MIKLINLILFFICFSSTTIMTTCVFCYYLKQPMEVQIVNPDLGGYEFTLWLIYIPNLVATYYTLKKINYYEN